MWSLSTCLVTEPGRPVPGVPAAGGRRGAVRGRRGLGDAVDQRVPRRARSADDRGRREHGVHADRAGPLRRPVRRARCSRRRSTAPWRCRAPAWRRSSPPTARSGSRRTRRASAHGWTSAAAGPTRAGPGSATTTSTARTASSARCRSCRSTATCSRSRRSARAIRRCGSCSAARASGCCSTSGSARRWACWRPGCCPGGSNGTPAGWRSPRSPASPIIGKRCCTASVRVWSR